MPDCTTPQSHNSDDHIDHGLVTLDIGSTLMYELDIRPGNSLHIKRDLRSL